MPEDNARLSVRLAAVTSTEEPGRYMELRIMDAASRLNICRITLQADDVMALLSNSAVGELDGVPSWLLPPESRHALGLEMVHATKIYDTAPPARDGDETAQWWDTTHHWAEEAKRLMGALTVDLTHKHRKLHATFRCYVDPASADNYRAMVTSWLDSWPGPHGTNR